MSALHYAALNACVETVHCLLQLGADPNTLDNDGDPALFVAIKSGDVDCVEMLIGVTYTSDHHSLYDNIQHSFQD